jgi:hypothetical protein
MSINRSTVRKAATLSGASQSRSQQTRAELKARQSAKIRELKQVLVNGGIATLDEQAKALALSRSTTWTILKGIHKGSGLSATIINRILASRQLPAPVRAKVLEYIEEKVAGCYGHSGTLRRRFVDRLSNKAEHKIAAIPIPKTGNSAPPASSGSHPRLRGIARGSARVYLASKPKQRRSTRL